MASSSRGATASSSRSTLASSNRKDVMNTTFITSRNDPVDRTFVTSRRETADCSSGFKSLTFNDVNKTFLTSRRETPDLGTSLKKVPSAMKTSTPLTIYSTSERTSSTARVSLGLRPGISSRLKKRECVEPGFLRNNSKFFGRPYDLRSTDQKCAVLLFSLPRLLSAGGSPTKDSGDKLATLEKKLESHIQVRISSDVYDCL